VIETLDVAVVQMNSTENKDDNVARAIELVELAAAQGAKLVVLPELFNCLAHHRTMAAMAEPIPGPTSRTMSELAARLKITLLSGSICERPPGSDACYNTALLFNEAGELLATYRKMHLFDIDLQSGTSIRESEYFAPGDGVVALETPHGKLGLAICYDLRFPELFRSLAAQGIELLLFTSAFTQETGRAHWETLVRARAIENQVFLIASNQCGRHAADMVSYGHSVVFDPWGECLAMAGEEEVVIFATLDASRLRDVRSRLPALEHRRDL